MKGLTVLTILMLVALAGMFLALFPGESADYWANGALYRISFTVVDGSWCYWRVISSRGAFVDDGYLYHTQIRQEGEVVPQLECNINHLILFVSSHSKTASYSVYLSEVKQ